MELNKTPYRLQTITQYPNDPSELPSDVYAHAYSETAPPVYMHIEHFERIGEHIPVRSSSNLLKGSTYDRNSRMRSSGSRDDGNFEIQYGGHGISRSNTSGRWSGRSSYYPIVDDASRSPSPQSGDYDDREYYSRHQPAGSGFRRQLQLGADAFAAEQRMHAGGQGTYSTPPPAPVVDAPATIADQPRPIGGTGAPSVHPSQSITPVHSRLGGMLGSLVAPKENTVVKTTEEQEEEAFVALINRKECRSEASAKKRKLKAAAAKPPTGLTPAAVAAEPSSAPVIKKPASVEPPLADVLKKPSAVPVHKKPSALIAAVVIKKPAAADADKILMAKVVEWEPAYLENRHAWVSRCYKRGLTVAKTAGKDEDGQGEFARACRELGCDSWDNNH